MNMDLSYHASDTGDDFNIKLEANDVTEEDMAFALASVIHAFELIERGGVAGAASLAGKAIAMAEVMAQHKDDEEYFRNNLTEEMAN